jgi:hypothetical protein
VGHLISVCEEFEDHDAGPGMRVACIFEEQGEFGPRSKGLLDKFRAINLRYSARLGTVSYAGKTEFVPLEIADNLAYEAMKEILNKKYDPTRPRRIAMEKMIPRIRKIKLLTEDVLLNLANKARIARDLLT